MGRIRAFVQDDIPRVAELNWQFLQGQRGPHPPRLEEYFRQVFFHNPWFDSSIGSLVYEEGRRVVGFLGIVPRPMSVNGKPIQAAFGSGLVVHPESRWTLPGPQLLAAFMGGKQDLAMTDTASEVSQQIWVELGGSTSAAYSLQWARPLRPGSYALYAMARFGREGRSGAGGRACRVLHKTVSTVATRIPLRRLRRPPSGATEEELEIDTLLHSCLPGCSAGYSLRPEYNRESLGWLLDFMSRMKAYGNLRKVALRDATREIIGWFIYYAKHGGIADVVQIGATKLHMKTVFDHLLCDAWNHGAIGLHGRLEIRHAQQLSESRCFFWGTIPLLFRARNPELARLVQQGDAFLSRLDGEWCLRFGASGQECASAALNLLSGKESSPPAIKSAAPSNFQPSQALQARSGK
jgi:hypothetical protein